MTRLRTELRARWRAWAVVALFIGFAGGVVLTATAGARRTATAYDRFLTATHGADLLVSPDQTGFPRFYDALARATGATITPVIGFGAAPVRSPDKPVLIMASPDERLGTLVERPKVTAGRLPRSSDASEVLSDPTTARLLHLRPGSTLAVRIAGRNEELPSVRDDAVTLRIVGVGVTRNNVVFENALASAPTMLASPAFARRFGPEHYAFDGAEVTLTPGISKAAFTATTQALGRRMPETGGNIAIADQSNQVAQVNHAIRPQAVALALFAALTALTALVAIGQLVARRLFLGAADNGTLRALGMSRSQLLATEIAQVSATATLGGLLALLVAVLASPTMPIGPARVAEPHPGVALDWPVLGSGFIAIVVLFVACAAWPAWRLSSRAADDAINDRRSRVPSMARRWTTAAGAPPAMAIGIGHAIDPGRGRRAVPARTAIAVTALAVAAISAAATFGTNLSRLVRTPRLYGQSWDVTIDSQFSPLPPARVDSLLRALTGVTAWTYGTHSDLTVDGQIIPAIALATGPHGLLAPTVISGRAAVHPHEVLIGTKTLEHLHRRVGDTITATLPRPGSQTPAPQQLSIVGRGVFPFFGEGSFTPTGLGVGAQVTEPAVGTDSGPPLTVVLVAVAPGTTHEADITAVLRAFERAHLCGPYNQCTISSSIRPTDILNYSRVQGTPRALAAVLALLAIGVVADLLVTSIRRRRHDLAILKTLGFGRRGISAVVAWQATTLVGVALLLGLPAGIAIGRWVWSMFADGLGLPSEPRTPMLAALLAIPFAVLIGNAIAALPGYFAGRTAPVKILRSE